MDIFSVMFIGLNRIPNQCMFYFNIQISLLLLKSLFGFMKYKTDMKTRVGPDIQQFNLLYLTTKIPLNKLTKA